MISRRTTLRIQLLYHEAFCEMSEIVPSFLEKDKLYDFLYEEDFPGWFLDLYQRQVHTWVDLRNFILNLHTGMAYVSKNQTLEDKKAIGQSMLQHLAVSILKMLEPDFWAPGLKDKKLSILGRGLLSRLELDGYIYKNEQLFPAESSVIKEQEEQSYLEELVSELQLPEQQTIKHHLNLSEDHFLEGKWDDSISNSRKVLDAILKQLTELIYLKLNNNAPPEALLKNATDVRLFLEKQKIITTAEREALNKVYGVLSVTGGHPYIAEKDQARLMRHLALTFSQFLLLRLQGFLTNNP